MLTGLKTPLEFFFEISKIPRASKEEEKIADALVAFATENGLWCYRDEAHNVLIKKSATKGREKEPPVLLQAHTDMVTEKHPWVEHDFQNEGLSLKREGNLLSANGTTLGADDGFGVAMMLSVLADGTLSHPALECLFTSAEEIGLEGASRFDYQKITAKHMVNLDSAEEDTVIVGCCGGLRSKLCVPASKHAVTGAGFLLTVGGLCGGHSGEDIHRNRQNALVLTGKLLKELGNYTPFRISHMLGGDKTNAIPRDCQVGVVVENKEDALRFGEELPRMATTFIKTAEDSGLSVTLTPFEVSEAYDTATTKALLRVLSLPNGILKMRKVPPIMPQASRNLASVRCEEEGAVFRFSARSAYAQDIAEMEQEQKEFAGEIGGEVFFAGRYPGWESEASSPLVVAWQNAFRAVTGKTVTPTLIHAGLETGLITGAVKGLSAIAVGCNIHDLHTPAERMEIDSFERIYRVLTLLLGAPIL